MTRILQLTEFIARHLGALLFVVCSLTICAAFFRIRPDLTRRNLRESYHRRADFFGSLTRTSMMTAIAIMDGSLAVLFTAYLLGL